MILKEFLTITRKSPKNCIQGIIWDLIKIRVLPVKLDEELEKTLDYLVEKRKIHDKPAFIHQLLNKAIKEDLINYLCDEVKSKQMSSWKAAEVSKISLRAFLHELAKREIIQYNTITFENDLKFVQGE